MTADTASAIWLAIIFTLLGAGVYLMGVSAGKQSTKDLTNALRRYRAAVDDVDRWCGQEFPVARLIATHLWAHGEGHQLNAGTPHDDEPCQVSGLREQLRRLSRKAP